MKKHLLLLLVALIFLTFHPILWNEFVTWDDGLLIIENPIVQELSFSTVRRAFTTYDPELYIPLTFLSYQVDHLLWGLNPVGFHLTNLILHTLNAILVFWLIKLLLGVCHTERSRSATGDHECDGSTTLTMTHSWVPLLCALLWALHPLNTEAVAWAAARKDLLSGFFFLLSLCGYLKYREQEHVTLSLCHSERSRGTTRLRVRASSGFDYAQPDTYYWCSVTTFLLGLLAKVSIVPLPLILLLLERFQISDFRSQENTSNEQRATSQRATYVHLLPFFLLSTVFGIIAFGGKHGNTGLLWEKALIGAKATIFYIGKLLWPTGFSVLYPYTRPIMWSNPDLLLSLLLILSLSTLAFFFRKKSPSAVFGWAFFLLMLLPSFTNFAKGHDQLRDVYFASDRYAYLPSIGILLFICSLLCHKKNPLSHWERVRVRGIGGLFACTLFLLSFLSYKQSFIWRNTETLFQNVLRHYPDSHIAWNNLGSIALRRGDTRTALEDYSRSLTIRSNAAAFFNLGQIALQEGLPSKAMELYRRAILSRPHDRDAHVNLGVLLLRNSQFTEASAVFQQAITIDDTFAPAHFNLGLALEALGDHDGAHRAFTSALELDPSDEEARENLLQ